MMNENGRVGNAYKDYEAKSIGQQIPVASLACQKPLDLF